MQEDSDSDSHSNCDSNSESQDDLLSSHEIIVKTTSSTFSNSNVYVSIPENRLICGSIWTSLESLRRSYILELERLYRSYGPRVYKIAHSGKSRNGFVVNCISDGKKARKSCKCMFNLVCHETESNKWR